MSLETNSRAARPPVGSTSNVVAMRPSAVCRKEAAPSYQVRAGGKIFQGRDLRALLRLAVAARTTGMTAG